MLQDLKRTFGQSAVYGAGNVLVKLTGLILLPVYLKGLNTDAYGMLILFEVMTQFIVGVFSFRLQSSLLRFGAESGDIRFIRRTYSTATYSMAAVALSGLVVFVSAAPLFNRFLFEGTAPAAAFPLLFASAAAEMLLLMPLQLCRLKEEPLKYTGIMALKLAGMLAFVSYFVLVRDLGVFGAVAGIFSANILALIATLPMQIKHLRATYDPATAKEMFRFGTPLIFTSISAILLSIGDRVIIKIFGEFSDVGVYGLAYKIGSVANLLVINSFSLGFLPVAYKKYKTPGFRRFFSKMLTYFSLVTVLLTLGVSLFSKELIAVLSKKEPDYMAAVILVPFIAFTFIFKAMQFFISIVFHLTKRTRYDALVTMSGFGFNIALNFALIPFYGIYGAVAATGLSYLSMGLVTKHYARKQLQVDYEFRRLGILVISCAVCIAAGMAVNPLDLGIRLPAKILLTGGYLVFLYAAVADAAERGKFMKVVHVIRREGLRAAVTALMK